MAVGAAVEAYLYLMDAAFNGTSGESLMDNLGTVREREWLWVPPGGDRPIAAIVAHVANCKRMYLNHAFGDARMTWGQLFDDTQPSGLPGKTALLQSLGEAHAELRTRAAGLADPELTRLRRANWGEMKE